jgi:acetylornithine deacetylase/succinyl-diaminopimelate desuccinylase-like protein
MSIQAYIADQRERFIRELQAFCRQPSIANTGEGMSAMADMVADRLRQLGATVTPVPLDVDGGYPYICADIGHGPRTLLIYNHYDVQPARIDDGMGWTDDPFNPVIRDGRLYARGVADNKANLLFRIQAVETYQAVYGDLPLRVRFFIEGEEEIGSPHLPHVIATHPDLIQADGCIWESGRKSKEQRPTLQMGLRGILYLELTLQAPHQRAVHSSWANIATHPARSVRRQLETALDSLTDDQGRPIFGTIRDTLPALTPRDYAMLQAIPFDLDEVCADHGVILRDDITDGVEALRRLLFEPTCTVCGLWSGYSEPGVKTTIPNDAHAKLDIRLPPGMDPDHVERAFRQHLHDQGFPDIQVRRLVALRGARTSPDAAIVRAMAAAVRHTYGVEPILYPLMPASGPMYDLCAAHGIPTVTFGAGHAGDNVHGIDENVYLDDYVQAMTAFCDMLPRFAATDDA